MTTLEIILIIFLWIIVGFFICSKRKWYQSQAIETKDPQSFIIIVAVIFAPINLLITFIKIYIVNEWIN
jgi:predicted permease